MGAIMDIVVKVSRDILYEGGDINGTIPPPTADKMVGVDPGNCVY